jgi:hypothetical protein
MFLTKQSLEKIFYDNLDPDGIKNYLAQQEIERIVELIFNVITNFVPEYGHDSSEEYSDWASKIKQSVINEFESSEDLFGFKEMPKRINLDDLLNKVFTYETQQFL